MGGCQSLKGLREVTFFIAHQAFGRRSMRIVAIVGAAIGGDGVDKCVVCHLPTRRLLCMMRRRNCMGHLNMVINLKPYCCVVLGLLLLHLPILHWSRHALRGTRRRTTSCMNESSQFPCIRTISIYALENRIGLGDGICKKSKKAIFLFLYAYSEHGCMVCV